LPPPLDLSSLSRIQTSTSMENPMSTSASFTSRSDRRAWLRTAAAAAVAAAALTAAALTGSGLAGGDQAAATLEPLTSVGVKPVGDPGTTLKAKRSSWALPATTVKRVTSTAAARGSSWS
jgi:hypothetical protein